MEAREEEFLFLVQLKCNLACFLYYEPAIRKISGGHDCKKYGSITKLVGFRIPDIVSSAHVK